MTYKIIAFAFTAVGHTNPILKIVNELIKTYNANVIVYSVKNFRKHIESINAEYRTLEDTSYEENIGDKVRLEENFVKLLSTMLDTTYENVEKHTVKISEILENENPDIVLYDNFAVYVKFAIDILKKKYNDNPDTVNPPPLSITYWTTFVSESGMFLEETGGENTVKFTAFETIRLVGSFLWYDLQFKKLFNQFGIKYPGVKNLFQKDSSVLNIVLTFPELHPRSHLYDSDTVFVGSCITDDVHINGAQKHDNSEVNKILAEFPVINPQFKVDNQVSSTRQLIYISFGTVFTHKKSVYSAVIEAFNEENDNLAIIFSLGQDILTRLENEIAKGSLRVPKNMLLVASAPQLEILKRASLFITHSGLNSTSESIYYGVPMISLPVLGDQPFNAHRIGNELGLGIELNVKKVNSKDIKKAVDKILNDESFSKRCNRYAKLSAEYIGHKNAANVIIDYIERKNKEEVFLNV